MPFRFGAAAPEPLPDKMMEFYRWLAETITGESSRLFEHGSYKIENTIALNFDEFSKNHHIILDKFVERVLSWEGKVNVAIVDIANPPGNFTPGRIEINLAHAIGFIFDSQEIIKPNLFILLLSELPPEGIIDLALLEKHIAGGKVVIIDNQGELLGNQVYLDNFDYDQYKMQLINARQKPLELLRLKMIRRLGHFKRDFKNPNSDCIRYYYDGTDCERELIQLIKDHIINKYHDKIPLLLYYRETTEWLSRPVMALAETIGAICAHVDEFLAAPEKYYYDKKINPLIIFPLIDTGKTIESILSRWNQRQELTSPYILSILSSTGSSEIDGYIKLTVNGSEHVISYLLLVDRTKYSQKICPMCKLGIPLSKPDKENYLMFTTYDMWEMADQAGWKPETEVPESRKGLNLVPRFPEMIHKNGAWIARNIRNRLAHGIEGFPAMPMLIVCPDERGAKALVGHLEVFQWITIVRVPKEAINSCYEEDIEWVELEKQWKNKEWFFQLANASKNLPVVIVEEFILTGGTRAALRRIVERLKLNVTGHFSLVDFNPVKSASYDKPCYSLYDVQITLE